MTRCYRETMNLKSSGQRCAEQLSVYRSMCSHLRRVLMAKSVVDTRNPRFARSIQRRCRPANCKLRFLDKDFCCPSSETIDKLAYDTEHHPSEIIRVTCHNKSSPKERSCSRDRERAVAAEAAASNDANCPCLHPGTTKGHSSIIRSNMKNQKRPTEDCCVDCRMHLRTKEFDYDKQGICDSKCDGSPTHRSCRSSCRKWSLHEETAAATDQSPRRYEQTFCKLAEQEEEEALYAKFIYDITQEIVQNGLYTDRELKEVFAKHLERSSARLNKNKMLYEIYQLKISLNMLDESDEEDELEADLVFAEKFSNLRVPKPPTPPKVLNENKVLEKLELFKQHENGDHSTMSTPSGRKNVVLVDANPEFLITQRDVLTTLADNDVEPQRIERIYKNLFHRSKDMSLCEAVQVGTEVAYSHRLKQVDRCTSATSLNSTYIRERPHGILRKDSMDFLSQSLSPQTTRRKSSYVPTLNQQNKALEKWTKLGTCLCDNKIPPSKEHLHLVEKKESQSPKKIPAKSVLMKDKLRKKPGVEKKVKVIEEPGKPRNPKQMKSEKPIEVVVKKKEVKSSPEFSDYTSSAEEVMTEEKQDISSKTQSSLARENVASEEPVEEIEEDIESLTEESPEKSPRRLSYAKDKPDNEEKEQASSPEKSNDEHDEVSSIASENDSAKYSDDFSNVSEDSSEDTTKTSKLPAPTRKLTDKRYVSMKDYFDHFATLDEQKIWSISEGSSSSSSSTSLMFPRINKADNANNEVPQQKPKPSETIKKRSSSKVFFTPYDASRDKLSNEFRPSVQNDYCIFGCRHSTTKGCSDNCKFVQINCRNLSRPTDCLNKAKQSVLSNASTSTSS